jgi:cytidylate kinase
MTIVAISRGTLSGGEALAERVAERLGVRCLSREVLLDATREYGVALPDLEAAMDRPPSFWERVTGARRTHLLFVRAALCLQAVQGPLVYHGYVGHLLLPGVSHVLRVRAVADLEYRVQALREQHRAWSEAVDHIRRVDQERKNWVRFLFNLDWNDPLLFDLVVNLSRIGIDTACEAVAQTAARPEFQATPQSLQALRDLALASRVEATLAADPRTKGVEVHVSAADGIVHITGSTAWSDALDALPGVARGVPGVTAVLADVKHIPSPFYPSIP